MELHPHAQSLGTQLGRFNTRQLLYYSLTIVERAMPFYLHFARLEKIGDPDRIAAKIASAWDSYDLTESPNDIPIPIVPEKWNNSPYKPGYFAGQIIALFVDFLEQRDRVLVQQQADMMLAIAHYLSTVSGEDQFNDEIAQQKNDLEKVRNLVEDDPTLLTDFITEALETASRFAAINIPRLN